MYCLIFVTVCLTSATPGRYLNLKFVWPKVQARIGEEERIREGLDQGLF